MRLCSRCRTEQRRPCRPRWRLSARPTPTQASGRRRSGATRRRCAALRAQQSGRALHCVWHAAGPRASVALDCPSADARPGGLNLRGDNRLLERMHCFHDPDVGGPRTARGGGCAYAAELGRPQEMGGGAAAAPGYVGQRAARDAGRRWRVAAGAAQVLPCPPEPVAQPGSAFGIRGADPKLSRASWCGIRTTAAACRAATAAPTSAGTRMCEKSSGQATPCATRRR